mmetsp:Transcript_63050/g.199541  ORF Transcript_63050/g.199541 Transcript_63050/m.199541 type:complete len:215 (+) Transcript_63050:756-1400(+)
MRQPTSIGYSNLWRAGARNFCWTWRSCSTAGVTRLRSPRACVTSRGGAGPRRWRAWSSAPRRPWAAPPGASPRPRQHPRAALSALCPKSPRARSRGPWPLRGRPRPRRSGTGASSPPCTKSRSHRSSCSSMSARPPTSDLTCCRTRSPSRCSCRSACGGSTRSTMCALGGWAAVMVGSSPTPASTSSHFTHYSTLLLFRWTECGLPFGTQTRFS